MTKETEKNYTEAQETAILKAATEAGGKINAAIASTLATEFGKEERSVIMKAVRMGVYQAKGKQAKKPGNGETREELALEIAEFFNKTYNGLEKAPRAALVDIRDFLVRFDCQSG